jgi:hypothetical protein
VLSGTSNCDSVYSHLNPGRDGRDFDRNRKTSFYQPGDAGFKITTSNRISLSSSELWQSMGRTGRLGPDAGGRALGQDTARADHYH